MNTITDITSVRADLDGIGRRLVDIYARFDPDQSEDLLGQEETIVRLVNRYNELSETIERSEAARIARANILAGWALVQEIMKGLAS